MKDVEYEIVPENELEYLRHEVEKLKRNPLGDTQASLGLLDSLNKLNANIEQMLALFKGVNDEMVKTFNDTSFQEELRKVRQENAKIAHGIVAIAELVKKLEKEQGHPLPQEFVPESRPMPQPHIEFDEHGLAQELNQPKPPNPFSEPKPAPPRPMAIPDDEVPPPPPRR